MENHEIIIQVESAKTDPAAADALIEKYLPFIRSETAKFTKKIPREGYDDELSIAMFAFYESVMSYDMNKGSFLKLAALNIRNRLIDHSRKEKRHGLNISLDEPCDDSGKALVDKLDSGKDDITVAHESSAAREEINEFALKLASFGISLSDVADSCPRQDRTLKACLLALEYAKNVPDILRQVELSGRLPAAEIAIGTGVERKTLERHRKYVVAMIIAYTNGYDIIRGHLCDMGKKGV